MMNIKKYFFLFSFLITAAILNSCGEKNNKETNYANVFKPLDGTWSGDFIVYVDTAGQQKGIAQPTNINFNNIKNPSLKKLSVIKSKHIYRSVSNYIQKGEIIDIIKKSDATTDTIISKAINFVENGKLKCIVTKPNETVIHDGEYLGNNTIVWHRNITKPKRIEYFKETVDSLHYKIIGWGYYGKDDPNMTPRYWFYADYIKTVN